MSTLTTKLTSKDLLNRSLRSYKTANVMGPPPSMRPKESKSSGYDSDDGIYDIKDITLIHMEYIYSEMKPVIDDDIKYKCYKLNDIRFVLTVFPTGVAELQGIKQVNYAPMDTDAAAEQERIDTGKRLLSFGYDMAKHIGARILVISENSYIDNIARNKVPLLTKRYMSSGEIWMRDVIPTLRLYKSIYKRDIETMQKDVLTKTWATIADGLKQYGHDIQMPVDISDININEEGSAVKVLTRINEHDPTFLIKNYDHISWAGRFDDLNRVTWIADIPSKIDIPPPDINNE